MRELLKPHRLFCESQNGMLELIEKKLVVCPIGSIYVDSPDSKYCSMEI